MLRFDTRAHRGFAVSHQRRLTDRLRAAAKVVRESLFTNRYLWHADPDMLCVRRPLNFGEVRAGASLFGLTGILMASSDKLAKLPRSRLHILTRILPLADIFPLDQEPRRDLPSICNRAIRKHFGNWNVVGVFSWGQGTGTRWSICLNELGLDGRTSHLVFEIWNQRFLGCFKGGLALDISPRSCRVIALHVERQAS